MTKLEWALKNYLNKHEIYKDNEEMQNIIINSFVNERGASNDLDWVQKCIVAQKNFGLFCQYANSWKMKEKL